MGNFDDTTVDPAVGPQETPESFLNPGLACWSCPLIAFEVTV